MFSGLFLACAGTTLAAVYLCLILAMNSEMEKTLDGVTLASLFALCAAVLTLWIFLRKSGVGQDRRARSDIPPLDGHAFEFWVAARMRRQGWKVRVTQSSGDQGIDIIARRGGRSLGIQCKRYSGSVGNKAVQEAFAGCAHYRLDKAAVLTTGYYTKSARELSRSTGVALLNVSDIPSMHQIVGTMRK